MLEYGEMKREDLVECASLAAEAFSDYEYFSIYIPGDRRRLRFLHALILCEFKANWRRSDVVFLTAKDRGKIVAVAQLCTPDFKDGPSDMDYIRAGWPVALLRGGPGRVGAWLDMDRKASAPCHALTGEHWYLSLLTVARECEGKGIGSRFLNDCLIPYVQDAKGESLSLFTNSETNRMFYEKNGFRLFDEKRFEYEGKAIGSWSYGMDLRD